MEHSHYASTAYDARYIPDQPPSAERSWIRRLAKMRLPWGGTQELAPRRYLERTTPEDMRFWEQWEKEQEELKAKGQYVLKPLEHLNFHDHFDHERYRFATLSKMSNFWLYLHVFSKWSCILIGPVYLLVSLFAATGAGYFWWNLRASFISGLYVFGPLMFFWALGAFVIHFFPKWWLRPSRGPLWEFNRRSGMVTLFDYDNNGAYKKHGSIGEIVAPFYEFDAYLATHPDRQGLPMNFLYLAHRYRDIKFSLADLVPMDSLAEPHFALWDFLQNYMDTSRPLPDAPSLEKYRPLDPVTAAHDQRSGRNPRYWIDMDDDSFKAKLKYMLSRIGAIDTLSRPNLMARHVEYTD